MTYSGAASKLFIFHTDFRIFNVLKNAIVYTEMIQEEKQERDRDNLWGRGNNKENSLEQR